MGHGSLGSGPTISAWRSSTNRRDSARDANRCAAYQLPSAELARRNTSGLRSRAPAGRPSAVHSDGKAPDSRNLRPHSSNAGHAYGPRDRTGSSRAAASRVLSPRSAFSAKMSTTAADCSSVRPASCRRTNSRRKIAAVTLEPGAYVERSMTTTRRRPRDRPATSNFEQVTLASGTYTPRSRQSPPILRLQAHSGALRKPRSETAPNLACRSAWPVWMGSHMCYRPCRPWMAAAVMWVPWWRRGQRAVPRPRRRGSARSHRR